MPSLEPRDRFIGSIAGEPGSDPEDPAVVDFGDLVRKLILFDELIIESHNLKEFAPLTQKFGYDGLKALLESGRVRFLSDMTFIVDFSQAPMPHRTGFLPLGSYAINATPATPPRDFRSRQLQKIDAVPGLTFKQARKLRELAGRRIMPVPQDAIKNANVQISQDFAANLPILRTSLALALKRSHQLDISASALELRLADLGHNEWHAETNLAQLTDLTPKQLHDVTGQGLSGGAGIDLRLALMQSFRALTGFQVNDLPLFEEKAAIVFDQVNPDLQGRRFDRVYEVAGLPDVSSDLNVQDVDMDKLLEITEGAEVRDFRQWLRTSDAINDDELAEIMHPVKDAVGKAVRSPLAKAVRLAATTGVGVLVPPAGVAMSVLDSFLVDKVMPHAGPTAFLSHLSRSVFD